MNEYDILYEKLKNYPKYPSVGNRIKLSKSGKRLNSLLLGIRSKVGAYYRKNKKLNPNIMEQTTTPEGNELYKIISTIIKNKYPDFNFNQIDNILRCIEDRKPYDILHIKNNPIIFKGKEIYHSTQDFIGDRYCVVAYMNKIPLKYIPY